MLIPYFSLMDDFQPLVIPSRLKMLIEGHKANIKCLDHLGPGSHSILSGSRYVPPSQTMPMPPTDMVVMGHYVYRQPRMDPYDISYQVILPGYGIVLSLLPLVLWLQDREMGRFGFGHPQQRNVRG
jgi:hypothetical protein